jgi:hypothetical protein
MPQKIKKLVQKIGQPTYRVDTNKARKREDFCSINLVYSKAHPHNYHPETILIGCYFTKRIFKGTYKEDGVLLTKYPIFFIK